MKKKTILKLLILAMIALVIVLAAMYFIIKGEDKAIPKEKLEEIEMYLRNTEFLNCVYNSPEEIRPYYILSVSKQAENQTKDDNAEYLYLLFEDKLEDLYPEVLASKSLNESEKALYIKADLLNENEETPLAYKKITYSIAKKIMLENTTLTETKVTEILEQFKNLDTVFYSELYDCFYLTIPGKDDLASSNSLECVRGTVKNNQYTVTYTLKFSDTITDTIEYEVSFYEDENGIYKFISNRCIEAEKMLKKAEEFEASLGSSTKIVEAEDGTVYAYKSVTSKEGQLYYINGGKNTAYYQILYIKKDKVDYYFMDGAYVYFDKSEDTKHYYMNCYPRGITKYDFNYLKENFTNVIKNT